MEMFEVNKTYSLGINDVNDCAYFSFVFSVVDEDNTANFNKSSKGLVVFDSSNKKKNVSFDVVNNRHNFK